jgi:hypothetical protein
VASDYDHAGSSFSRNLVNDFRRGFRFRQVFDRRISEFSVKIRFQILCAHAAGLESQLAFRAFQDGENDQTASTRRAMPLPNPKLWTAWNSSL